MVKIRNLDQNTGPATLINYRLKVFLFFWDRKDKTDVGDRSDRKAKDRESFDSREILEVYGKYRYPTCSFCRTFLLSKLMDMELK